MEQQTGSKLGKEYVKAVYCHPHCLFKFYAEYIMRNARLDEAQAGIKIARRNNNNLRCAAEKAMATHSGTLAWKISWMEEPGRLQSTGSQRVGHNWSNLAAAADVQMTPPLWQKVKGN